MKKKSVVTVLISILLVVFCFLTAACVDSSDSDDTQENNIQLEYLYNGDILRWTAPWAERFTVIVYYGDNTDGEIIFRESDISALDNHRKLGGYLKKQGNYFAVVFAYKGDEAARETILINISEEIQGGGDDQQPPNEPGEDNDEKEDVGKLKNVYYFEAKSDEDLNIGLSNRSGVESVEAFDMRQVGDWNCSEEADRLHINSAYLNKFSVGAKIALTVGYVDGRKDKINVQIVNKLPMDVIKGQSVGSSGFNYNLHNIINISNLTLNYDVFLGYGDEVSQIGSALYVKEICVDGKKLMRTSYTLYSSQSKIRFTYNTDLFGMLSNGIHLLEIYTAYGKSEVWLNVKKSSDRYPQNVEIDYDTDFPNVYIKWKMQRDDAEKFVVDINGVEYASDEYPDLFDGYCFDATGKIKYNDEVKVISYINGKSATSVGTLILDIDIDNKAVKEYLSYDESFEYLGTRYNLFIKNYDELKDLIFYSLIYYNDLRTSSENNYEKMWKIYVSPSYLSNSTELASAINSAKEYFNEGVNSTWNVKGGYINIYEIHFKVVSTCIPDSVVRTSDIKENHYNDYHISATGRSEDFNDFAVEKFEKVANVNYSEELYLALERGIRPIPRKGSSAEKVYDRAKQILRRIISDNMNDYQKVHAIVDWLSSAVSYNWALSEEISKVPSSSEEYRKFYSYRELFLEGAILDGLAICNGYAKAVSLLCGIEGIQSYKIKGASGKGEGLYDTVYQMHAWNKVRIDGTWYVVDSTWANEKYKHENDNGSTKEVLKHNTLFMSEEESGNFRGGNHYEIYQGDYTGYFAGSSYDVFANTFFRYDGNLYDMVIDSADELNILLQYITQTKGQNMGKNSYATVDVKCSEKLLAEYIDALKEKESQLFESFAISTKYNSAYGTMCSIVLWKK